MGKIKPNVWFNFNAEEAMAFYKTVFPEFELTSVVPAVVEANGIKEGDVLVVNYRIFDQEFVGINGGPIFPQTEAFSISIDCADQAEVDYYWNALTADGGQESVCGWLKDKFGLSWQVTPTRLMELVSGPDKERARRATEAMYKQRKIVIAEIEAAADGR